MSRLSIRLAAFSVVATTAMLNQAFAQGRAPMLLAQNQQARPAASQQPVPIRGVGAQMPRPLYQNGYPYLGAPMYPSPVPYVPPEVGSTVVTNQALAPHELLYPHRYHAMYGPFYYEQEGRWYVGPRGVRRRETWELKGTEVKVEYKDHISPFALFHPPTRGISLFDAIGNPFNMLPIGGAY